jgi:hypothetical protein
MDNRKPLIRYETRTILKMPEPAGSAVPVSTKAHNHLVFNDKILFFFQFSSDKEYKQHLHNEHRYRQSTCLVKINIHKGFI